MSRLRVEVEWCKRVGCPDCRWHTSYFNSRFIDCCTKCGCAQYYGYLGTDWWTETCRFVSVPLGKHWWNGRDGFWQARRDDGNHVRIDEPASLTRSCEVEA